jgi:hypothetical protein
VGCGWQRFPRENRVQCNPRVTPPWCQNLADELGLRLIEGPTTVSWFALRKLRPHHRCGLGHPGRVLVERPSARRDTPSAVGRMARKPRLAISRSRPLDSCLRPAPGLIRLPTTFDPMSTSRYRVSLCRRPLRLARTAEFPQSTDGHRPHPRQPIPQVSGALSRCRRSAHGSGLGRAGSRGYRPPPPHKRVTAGPADRLETESDSAMR